MSVSRNTILALGNSLKAYLNENLNMPRVNIEFYHDQFINLEPRKDIHFARVAIYELPETVTDLVSSGIANLSEQRYGIDISVVRGYIKDDASRGELPLLDIKDHIVEWARVVDFGATTDVSIYTLSYRNSQQFIRNDRFVSRTFVFSAVRDLNKNQTG